MSYESISKLYFDLFAEHQALNDQYRVLQHQYNIDSNAANARWDTAKAQYDELWQHNERSQAAADAVKAELATLVNVQAHNAHLSQYNMYMSNSVAFLEQTADNSEQRWMRDVATIRMQNTNIVQCLENQLTNVNKNLLDANSVIHRLQGEIAAGDKTRKKLSRKVRTAENELALCSDAVVHPEDPSWYDECQKLKKERTYVMWLHVFACMLIALFYVCCYLYNKYKHLQ